jgi:hypothetical protein
MPLCELSSRLFIWLCIRIRSAYILELDVPVCTSWLKAHLGICSLSRGNSVWWVSTFVCIPWLVIVPSQLIERKRVNQFDIRDAIWTIKVRCPLCDSLQFLTFTFTIRNLIPLAKRRIVVSGSVLELIPFNMITHFHQYFVCFNHTLTYVHVKLATYSPSLLYLCSTNMSAVALDLPPWYRPVLYTCFYRECRVVPCYHTIWNHTAL